VFSFLGGAMASIAVWEIVAAAVFQPSVSRWLTLADGLVIGALACTGLVLHEVSRERVVHVLEVVERPPSTS
jgi:predicted TIM-barrel enzyme